MKRYMLTISLVILGLCVLGVSASAQDVFKINYFANNVSGAPDQTVRIDNPGTYYTQNLCAMIYVFQDDQQLAECCGCEVTANGLRTLSVGKDLTNNPLTGISTKPVDGVIKIVSSRLNNSPCDPTSNVYPQATIRAWGSHNQNKVGTAYPVTETEFSDATLSEEELSFNLQEQCSFAQRLGSGKGICTCGTGD
jgi:hypothetical protein